MQMEKIRTYRRVRFSADVLKEASHVFKHRVDPEEKQTSDYTLDVEVDNSEWSHDSPEEFSPTIEEVMAAHSIRNT